MTYEIAWADEAFAAAQIFMADDPVGLAAVFDAVDELSSRPEWDAGVAGVRGRRMPHAAANAG